MAGSAPSPDTIYALSSGAGIAGVAVVRVSGPGADGVLTALGVSPLPEPRYAALHNIAAPQGGEPLDRALVLRFPAPASFTGEDVGELHVHGGPAVLAALFDAIAATGLARLAEPGEFTRRAFENGKLDLTAAEGLADLVAAQTDAQRRQALRQYDGALAEIYEGWRARLVALLGNAEAEIDFSDEELPEGLKDEVTHNILCMCGEIRAHLDSASRGEAIRAGFQIAIVGAPNAGKSSLLNRLAARDVAIVSAQAGTTRDVIEVQLNLGGYAVTLSDTAGIRDAADGIEGEGVRRAEARAADAALRLVVVDGTEDAIPDRIARLIDGDAIVAVNKSDLAGADTPKGLADTYAVLSVSAKTGDGIDALIARLGDTVRARLETSEGAMPTRRRHRDALSEAVAALDRAGTAAYPELAAEDVRLALRALGRITGRVDIDEILDIVFREFCIGK
jgi:tRNA modification GTPase